MSAHQVSASNKRGTRLSSGRQTSTKFVGKPKNVPRGTLSEIDENIKALKSEAKFLKEKVEFFKERLDRATISPDDTKNYFAFLKNYSLILKQISQMEYQAKIKQSDEEKPTLANSLNKLLEEFQ